MRASTTNATRPGPRRSPGRTASRREPPTAALFALTAISLLLLGPTTGLGAAASGAGAAPGPLALLLGHPLLALFFVVGSGMLIGRVNVAGLSFGSSGVIFTGLAVGHLGFALPAGVGPLGLVLFVYCVGISAGPTFFRVFVQRGKPLALLGLLLVVVGAGTAWLVARWLALPTDLAAGIFAGAMTSTPGLAAAIESLPAGSQAAVGYGLAYPFGVVAVVLFVQLLPRLLRVDLDQLARSLDRTEQQRASIIRVLVEVLNPAVIGRRLREVKTISEARCLVSRVLVGDRLLPVDADLTLEQGQHLLLVGREADANMIVELLGHRSMRTDLILDGEQQRMVVVATSKAVVGQTLVALAVRGRFGVTVSRVCRHDVEFVPGADYEIERGDALTVIGDHDHIERFAVHAGHRAKSYDETDVISVAGGIMAGVLLGMVSVGLGSGRFSLGMAGGPLVVALVLGHFGHVGPVAGHLPRASRLLMLELGLVFFLADAGVAAGGKLLAVLQQHSATLLAAAAAIAVAPIIVGYAFGRFVLKLDLMQLLGAICGGMTSTPGLGVISAKTDSPTAAVSYAAAYPVALVLITVLTRTLVALLGGR